MVLIVENMMFSELIAKVYSFEDKGDQVILTTEANNNLLNTEGNKLDILPKSPASGPSLRRFSSRFSLKDNCVNRQMTNALKDAILNRKRLVFRWKEILKYIICCSLCKRKK